MSWTRGGALAVVTLVGACTAFGTSSSEPGGGAGPTDGGGPAEAGSDGAPCVSGDDDPKNCGRCGHDCLGGACAAGVCQPRELAGGLDTGFYMAVDHEAVYVTGYDRPGVIRIEKATGARRPLSQRTAFGITADDSYVYFCGRGDNHLGLFRVAKGGGSELRVSDARCVECLHRDGLLFATDYEGDLLRRSLADGSSPSVLKTSVDGAEGLAVDDTHVFFTAHVTGQLLSIGRDGGEAKTLDDTSPGARRLTIDETHVYWLEYTSAEVFRMRKDGTDRAIVATGPGPTGDGSIALDDAWVYWTVSLAEGGAVVRAPKTATSAQGEVLVSGLEKPIDVKVDGAAIYFTVYGAGSGQARLMRLAKP